MWFTHLIKQELEDRHEDRHAASKGMIYTGRVVQFMGFFHNNLHLLEGQIIVAIFGVVPS